MTQKLTPEEKAVAETRSAGRPRRNLQLYAIGLIFLLLVGGAIASYIKTGGRAQVPVSERAGTKADPNAKPNEAEFKRLVEQQGGGQQASGLTAPGQVAQVQPVVPLPGTAPIAGASASLLPPPPPPLTREQIAAMGGTPGMPGATPGAPDPRIPPLDLPYHAGTPGGGSAPARTGQGQDGTDPKQAEAAFMTAPTDVYVRNKRGSPVDAVRKLASDASEASIQMPNTKALESKIAEAANLARAGAGQKVDTDQRISSRIQQNERFADKAGSPKEPLRATAAPQFPYIAEGDFIPAVLTRDVATDLPGQIKAEVTSDVYDSFGRGIVLVPKGTQVLGVYNSAVAQGQDRLQVAFTRMIFPNGASLILENSPGADRRGASGVPGVVNNHFFRIFSTAIAIAAISFAVDRRVAKDSAGQGGSTINIGGQPGTAGSVAAQTFGNVAERVLDRSSSVGPTISAMAGTRLNIQVTRDLAIDPRLVHG